MTDPDQLSTQLDGELPQFPMARAAGCPFDPSPLGVAAQRDDPFIRVQSRGRTHWLATRQAELRELVADPRLSSDPAGLAQARPSSDGPDPAHDGGTLGFILMDDPEHERLRAMVTAPFTFRRVRALRPAVQRIADELVDRLLAGPRPVDLVSSFALPLPSLVICELLGVPYEDHDFFQTHSRTIVSRSTTMEQSHGAIRALGEYLGGLIGRRLAEPQDDLLGELAAHVARGELAIDMAVEIGVLLLLAGHETTANMIALGTLALLEHPDQLALLRAESGDEAFVAGAVEELLRYLSIVQRGLQRVVLSDIEYEGHVFAAGEGVIFPVDLANRDPRVFDDPDTLDLRRDARQNVAFGAGVHQCLGQPLARLELEVVYSTLYRRIPTLALAASLDDIPFKQDGEVYGVYELPVTW